MKVETKGTHAGCKEERERDEYYTAQIPPPPLTLHRLGQHARLGTEGSPANTILAVGQRRNAIRGAYATDEQPIADTTTACGRCSTTGTNTTSTHHGGHGIIRVTRYGKCPGTIVLQIGAGIILYAAEITFAAYADAVVLIGELPASHGIVIEAPHASTDGRKVLQATLIRTTNAATMYLGHAYAPQAWKAAAGYH